MKAKAARLIARINTRPAWLVQAHEQLDQAVLDAYGWLPDISDDDVLARLLSLNLEREPIWIDGGPRADES